MIQILFYLIVAHFLCDFALQSETMAIEKNPKSGTALQKAVPWYWWLSSHAFIHGGAVAVVTNNVWLGLFEVAAHWCIDLGKVHGKYSIAIDQALHLFLKFIYVCLLVLIEYN